MQANFKVLFKFLSLTIVSLLMLSNVSCESDKTDSDDPAEKGLIVSINSSWKDPELYMADNDGIKQGSGELKITSLRENQIEGVFNFEVKHIIKKENKVIVSNGKFKDKIVQ